MSPRRLVIILAVAALSCDSPTFTVGDYVGTWTGSDATLAADTLQLTSVGDSLRASLSFTLLPDGTRTTLASRTVQLLGDSLEFRIPLPPSSGCPEDVVTGRRLAFVGLPAIRLEIYLCGGLMPQHSTVMVYKR